VRCTPGPEFECRRQRAGGFAGAARVLLFRSHARR